MPELVLHVLPPSHPCHAVQAGLRLKGLEHERVVAPFGAHNEVIEEIYGPGRRTVPGMLVDGEPVHGSVAIMRRLEELAPEPALYPEPIAGAVREAEEWGERELQDLGRRLPWGALHFRPEAFGLLVGAGTLDPAGVDHAIRFIRGTWKYHGITAQRLAEDLAGLPALLDHADGLVRDGIAGGERPTAADLQIGATLRVLLSVGDVRPVVEGRPCEQLARRWFRPLEGGIPAGAFPAGWVPA